MTTDTQIPTATKTYLDISTGHVTRAEMDAIECSDGDGLPVSATYKYGAFLYVPEYDEGEDSVRRVRFPNVQKVIEYARTLDASLIRLDADGALVPRLPSFDW